MEQGTWRKLGLSSSVGFFYALDARTGQLLWKAPVAGIVQAAPMSYGINGRQYVAIAAGNSLYAYTLEQ